MNPQVAEARQSAAFDVDITAGFLPGAIAELARDAGVSIGTEGSLPRLKTPAVHGRMSVEEALRRLLRDSGYIARQVGPRAWRIERGRSAAPHPAAIAGSAPSPSEITQAEPIIVTASKRALELGQLPMSVSIFMPGGRSLAGLADGSAAVAEAMEGMSLAGRGPGRNRMFLRGIADSAFNGESQSTVAVVLDESRITYTAPDPDLRLIDIEQVEVLKGPQGSLYGAGALGGIYRVVTRKPELDSLSLAVAASAEANAGGGQGQVLSLVANVPLVRDAAAMRLVGYSGRQAGWIDSGSRANSNSTGEFGARGVVDVMLGSEWEAQASGLIQRLDSNDTGYVFEEGTRSRPAQRPEPHDNDLSHTAFRLTGRIGDVRLTASTGYTWHEVADTLDATIGAQQFGVTDPSVLADDREFRVWDSEARATGRWGDVDLLLGISQINSRQSIILSLENARSAPPLILDDDRRRNIDSAIFGTISVPLMQDLQLEGGARLFTSTVVESRLTDIGRVSRKLQRQGLTPSLSLAWQAQEDRLIFLRYGSAFRPGGADIANNGTIDALKSDELATIEAGWREQMPGGGSAEFGAFYSFWDHIQSDILQDDGLVESKNVGDGEIYGIEAGATIPVGADWQIEAGANFTRAVLVRDTAGLGSEGRRLPVVPEYTLRGGVLRKFTVAANPGELALRLRFIGPARLSFDPVTDRAMGNVLESSISARMNFNGLEAELSVQNLFDRKSDTFAFGNQLRFSSIRQFTPQDPLTARISVRKSF